VVNNSPHKIVLIADSLAMVRPTENISFNDTYAFKLAKEGYVVIDRSYRASTTESVLKVTTWDMFCLDSDYYILHLGVCDCAPRIFKPWEYKILDFMNCFSVLSRISNFLYHHLSSKRYYYTQKRNIQNVSYNDFCVNMQKIISLIRENNKNNKKIIINNIISPGSHWLKKSFRVLELVQLYNDFLYKLQQDFDDIHIVDLFSFTSKNPHYVLSDGHHISKEVHDFICSEIVKAIR
jgi:hypothetical protein